MRANALYCTARVFATPLSGGMSNSSEDTAMINFGGKLQHLLCV